LANLAVVPRAVNPFFWGSRQPFRTRSQLGPNSRFAREREIPILIPHTQMSHSCVDPPRGLRPSR
jgi:hypothetical protein